MLTEHQKEVWGTAIVVALLTSLAWFIVLESPACQEEHWSHTRCDTQFNFLRDWSDCCDETGDPECCETASEMRDEYFEHCD
jgi:hypothetical protein